jgi:hypothetical protein
VYVIAEPRLETLVYAASENGKLAISIFTDEAAAEIFKERNIDRDIEIQRLDVLRLLGLLAVIETMGITHVTIDPSRGTGTVPNASTIADLRAKLIHYFRAS